MVIMRHRYAVINFTLCLCCDTDLVYTFFTVGREDV